MSIFETYFKSRLVEMGWNEEMEVCWSLGSCQGDGVSFTGELTPEEMLTLYRHDHIANTPKEKKGAKFVQALRNIGAERELFEYAASLTDSSELAVSLTRSNGDSYVHRYMVDANNDNFHDHSHEYAAEDAEERAQAAPPTPRVQALIDGWDEGNWITWHDSWRDYVQERHHACAGILEKEGYDIIFASPLGDDEEDVWTFSTASYRVRVWKSRASAIDNDHGCWGDDVLCESLKEVVNGDAILFDLNASIHELDEDGDEGEELARVCYDTLIISKAHDNRHLNGLRSDIVRDALDELRELLEQNHQQAA